MKRLMTSLAALSLTAGLAHAQAADVPDNLEKLSNFQSTGATDFTFVEQGGDFATASSAISSGSSCRRASASASMPWSPMRATWLWGRRAS